VDEPIRPRNGPDRRNELAADRTVLAAERTYAAWVRTGLAALASGIGAKKLLEGVIPQRAILAVGSLLILFSAFSFGAAVWRPVYPGAPPPEPDVRRIHPALLVAVNGFLVLVALVALASAWFGRTGATDRMTGRPAGPAASCQGSRRAAAA
jgi:putative membrane protein